MGNPVINITSGSETVMTLSGWKDRFKLDGKEYTIVEAMDQPNTILDDILWREATDYDGHRTSVRSGLPAVYWRKLYKGTPVSRSEVKVNKDPIGYIEARSTIDQKMLELHRSQAKAFRFGEAKAFFEAMRQKMTTAMFYGDVANSNGDINGLGMRYAFKNAPQVVDAGGSGSECTSIFGVVWGENEVTGIFPKDSIAGLQHKDLGEHDAYDDSGNAYRAVSDLFSWNFGCSVRDWRCAVRICNIPVAQLDAAKGEAGFIDLQKLTTKAKNLIPPEKRMNMKWYMNSDVMTAMEIQSMTNNGNVMIVRRTEDIRGNAEAFGSRTITELHGCPIRQVEAILSTEEALPRT